MADIKPFRAYRPKKGMESKIAALPYDVYSREEAARFVRGNPDSFLAIDRAETQFEPEADMYAPEVYAKASGLLWTAIGNGTFVQDEEPCYYLYRQIMEGRSQTGIVACASIKDYQDNIIKKHENTRADKEEDRIRHVDACDAQTGPIFLVYESCQRLNDIINSYVKKDPIYNFVSEDGIIHQVWQIREPAVVREIRDTFSKLPSVYIADGHHRCASAVKVGMKRRSENPNPGKNMEYDYFLSVLFPEEELRIMDYNRVVRDLNGYTKVEFLKCLEEHFIWKIWGEDSYQPTAKGCFGMYLDHEWYELKAKDNTYSEDVVKALDVSILQDFLLEPVLGIADPKTDKRIDFVGGVRGLGELEMRVHTDMKVAFSLYPTSIRELFAVADAGMLMPPKSTWFEPKLRSGLFIHSLR